MIDRMYFIYLEEQEASEMLDKFRQKLLSPLDEEEEWDIRTSIFQLETIVMDCRAKKQGLA